MRAFVVRFGLVVGVLVGHCALCLVGIISIWVVLVAVVIVYMTGLVGVV